MRYLKNFFVFWYDFVIGDDWMVAVGIALALAATYAVARTSVSAWWIVPGSVAVILPWSLWRAIRRS